MGYEAFKGTKFFKTKKGANGKYSLRKIKQIIRDGEAGRYFTLEKLDKIVNNGGAYSELYEKLNKLNKLKEKSEPFEKRQRNFNEEAIRLSVTNMKRVIQDTIPKLVYGQFDFIVDNFLHNLYNYLKKSKIEYESNKKGVKKTNKLVLKRINVRDRYQNSSELTSSKKRRASSSVAMH